MAQRIGILTAGGDAPGLNAAIRGFGKAAIQEHGWELIGFRDGMRGLAENRFTELDPAALSGILTTGGTMLGTSRDKVHRMMVDGEPRDMVPTIVDNCEKDGIDALVCLGGGGTAKNAKRNCIVTKGKLNDPYTNTTIEFKRGRKSSDLIPIDHVVALGDAWYSGAYQWDADRRRNFANDPINLQATNRESNTQKSAKNAAEWLPPNTAYQCEYVGRQITIKSTYGLSVTPAEKNAMEKVLATCS